MNGNQPDLEVRIPKRYVQMMMDGEITGSMLLTMVMLYSWSGWDNGYVKKVSSKGLATASNDAYHRNTYQDALVRWEQMGEIKRHLTLGSHKSYPVTIHNYRAQITKVDEETGESVTKRCMINKHATITYREYLEGVRAEALDETLDEGVAEGVEEALDEGVQRTSISKHNILQDSLLDNKQESVQEQQPSAAPAAVVSPSDELKQQANRIFNLLGDKKPNGSMGKLCNLLRSEDSKLLIEQVLSSPTLVSAKLKGKASPVGLLIDSVVKGYAQEWLDRLEAGKARGNRRAWVKKDSVSTPPDGGAPPSKSWIEALEDEDGFSISQPEPDKSIEDIENPEA
ncbi:MAG: hypothetical protein ABSH01_20500 [Terriglobia bacterium]|jgi:hypothetical protein